jgi:two-component system, cell cycle response regulator DivK
MKKTESDMDSLSKVLIVDDDLRNIFALKAVLKSRGLCCVTASSAREGIQALTSEDGISVVLLDMMMPDMDGYEMIREMRTGPFPRLPIIAVTAQAMTGDREKCIEAGADGYISKPIDIDQLMDVLKNLIKQE